MVEPVEYLTPDVGSLPPSDNPDTTDWELAAGKRLA